MRTTKADLSVNVIIITIIALVVLIVITFIFTGKLTLFNQKITDCSVIKGYSCQQGLSCDEEQGFIQDQTRVCLLQGTKKVDPNNVCCVPLLKETAVQTQ